MSTTPNRGLNLQDGEELVDVSKISDNFKALDIDDRIAYEPDDTYLGVSENGHLISHPNLVYKREYASANPDGSGSRLLVATDYGVFGAFQGEIVEEYWQDQMDMGVVLVDIVGGSDVKVGSFNSYTYRCGRYTVVLPQRMHGNQSQRKYFLTIEGSAPNVFPGQPIIHRETNTGFDIVLQRTTNVNSWVRWAVFK